MTLSKFLNYGIQQTSNLVTQEPIEGRYEIVKYNDERTHFVIAYLSWNKKEHDFDFESVGTRYLQYGNDKLSEYLLKWCELEKYRIECREELEERY